MSKPEPKKTSPVFWIGLVAVCIVIYFFVGEEPAPTGKGKARVRPKAANKTDKDGFLPADYSAKFAPVELQPVNAFKPLVSRQTGRSTVPTMGNGIPPAFAGGETGWIFTGVATVDGVANGLVENETSGEGVFLKPGERWKTSRVLTITKDEIVMQGPEGDSRTIRMESEFGSESDGSLAPLPLPISGPIGASPVGGRGSANAPAQTAVVGVPTMAPQGFPAPTNAVPFGQPGTTFDASNVNDNQNRRRRRRDN